MKRFFLTVLLLAAAPAGYAATTCVYKWTDDSGHTHFSNERPPLGVAAECIEVRRSEPAKKSTPRKSNPHAVAPNFKELEAKAKKAQAKVSESYRQRRCREAKEAKDHLELAAPLEARDDQWGAAMKVAKRDIGRWCE